MLGCPPGFPPGGGAAAWPKADVDSNSAQARVARSRESFILFSTRQKYHNHKARRVALICINAMPTDIVSLLL
jgi:hypothetical protein